MYVHKNLLVLIWVLWELSRDRMKLSVYYFHFSLIVTMCKLKETTVRKMSFHSQFVSTNQGPSLLPVKGVFPPTVTSWLLGLYLTIQRATRRVFLRETLPCNTWLAWTEWYVITGLNHSLHSHTWHTVLHVFAHWVFHGWGVLLKLVLLTIFQIQVLLLSAVILRYLIFTPCRF